MERSIKETYIVGPTETVVTRAIGTRQVRTILIRGCASQVAVTVKEVNRDRSVRLRGVPGPASHSIAVRDVMISLQHSATQAHGVRTSWSVICHSQCTRAQTGGGWRKGDVDRAACVGSQGAATVIY